MEALCLWMKRPRELAVFSVTVPKEGLDPHGAATPLDFESVRLPFRHFVQSHVGDSEQAHEQGLVSPSMTRGDIFYIPPKYSPDQRLVELRDLAGLPGAV